MKYNTEKSQHDRYVDGILVRTTNESKHYEELMIVSRNRADTICCPYNVSDRKEHSVRNLSHNRKYLKNVYRYSFNVALYNG